MQKIIGIAVAAAAGLACGTESKPEMSSQIQRANAPDWVSRGSGAFAIENGKIFYGVGIVPRMPDPARRRTTADARARTELGKTLDARLAAVGKNFQDSAAVQQALRNFSQAESSRSVIVDHWVDNDGTEYALAQLSMDDVKDNMSKMKELNEAVKNAVRANADKAFDELNAEEAKHQK